MKQEAVEYAETMLNGNVKITYQKNIEEKEMLVQCQCDQNVLSFHVLAQDEAALDMILDWIALVEYHGGEE